MNPLDLFKGIDKAADIVDDNVFSRQEREEMLTRRLEIDTNSDNPLAKMIRPIALSITGAVWAFVFIASVFKPVTPATLYAATATFTICLNFYFIIRTKEKIEKRKAFADIKIEKEKLNQQRVLNRREARLERMKAHKIK